MKQAAVMGTVLSGPIGELMLQAGADLNETAGTGNLCESINIETNNIRSSQDDHGVK